MFTLVQLKVLAAVARHQSVTEAARQLHYSQPSVSHHLARLEAACGAKLVRRVGRGIRLTPEGRILADRAGEILGRLDAAGRELTARVELRTGRVRLAANASALSTIVARAAVAVAEAHPGLELTPIERHPDESLELLRLGEVDVALVFQHDDAELAEAGFRAVPLGRDAIFLLSRRAGDRLAEHRDSVWIGGCQRCTAELRGVCARAGFTPRIGPLSDDIAVVQALVAAGLGVATQPGLSLRAHRRDDIHAAEVPGYSRRLYAVTYGEPPDPPAVAAVLGLVAEAAEEVLGALD